MKYLATYETYERANEIQEILLSVGVRATIRHDISSPLGGIPHYALFVEAQQVEVARALLRPDPSPHYGTIIRCPYCGSRDVEEIPIDRGFGSEGWSILYTFMIPPVYRMIKKIRFGTEWLCSECENRYRSKA